MNVTIVNDNELEEIESFEVTLGRTSDLESRIILAPVIATITIGDDDGR